MTLLAQSQSLAELMGTPFEVLDEDPHSKEHQQPHSFLPEQPRVVLYSEKPSPEQVLEMHDPEATTPLEFHEEMPSHAIEIELSDLPGVEELDEEKERALEVSDNTVSSNDTLRADVGEAKEKKSKKDLKWDWENRLKEGGSHGFVAWIKEKLEQIPQHTGFDSSGLVRAMAFLEKLDDEISRAMRQDLNGELDANKIEEVRVKIDDGIERLHDRIERVNTAKGKNKKKKKKAEAELGIVKQGQKTTAINGIIITVPLLISRIARVIINGTVSAGHDAEQSFKDQVKEYDLDKREQAELMQLLEDMGMPIFQNRGYSLDEDVDYTNGKYDFMSNWQA